MPRFDVNVSFDAVKYENPDPPGLLPELLASAFGATEVSELPEHFMLGGISVDREADGCYRARLSVTAENESIAKALGTSRVHEMLALFALSDDGFQIAFGRGVIVQPNQRSATAQPRSHHSGAMTATATLRVTATRTRNGVAFERQALRRKGWPEWFPVALDLNYAAVLAQTPTTKFVTLYSALEVMTAGLVGEPTAALPQQVGTRRRVKQILTRMRRLLTDEGVSSTAIKRIVQQAASAHSEGTVQRIRRALTQLGAEASEADEASRKQERRARAPGRRTRDGGVCQGFGVCPAVGARGPEMLPQAPGQAVTVQFCALRWAGSRGGTLEEVM